jgi:hypothetical protein
MSATRLLLGCWVVGVMLVTVGCGKAKEAATGLKNIEEGAKLGQTGKATFTDEKGQKIEVSADAGGKKTTITDDKGDTTVAEVKVDPAKLGIEMYPGAKEETGVTVDNPEAEGATAELSTTDPYDKVVKFYKDKYPKAASTEQSGDGQKTLTLLISQPPDMKHVLINQEQDGVKIMLQRLAEKKK